MLSHTNTSIVKPSPPCSVTDVQSLASAVNKQPQAWGEYIKALNTQLDELIGRNEALFMADKITQEMHNSFDQARLRSFSFKLSMNIYSNKLTALSLLDLTLKCNKHQSTQTQRCSMVMALSSVLS